MKRKKALHDEIERVAHELYKKRGMAQGYDLKDWLEAEKMVMEKQERHAKETKQRVDVIAKTRQGFRRHP